MSTWALIGIFALVFGIIIGNIMLVKRTANTKFGSSLSEAKKQHREGKQPD